MGSVGRAVRPFRVLPQRTNLSILQIHRCLGAFSAAGLPCQLSSCCIHWELREPWLVAALLSGQPQIPPQGVTGNVTAN
ncbi:hypothetical protein Y1Q_0004067 [Alligator mississippiensis]|uniref:Uncharacterized protein n=1 Tax=Alligator mississippiensis TaxID=8496 RepID=A0A151PI10_ALLMI|nr:hypothetical protein Y1Q_0004067 [Alligator mississippiensis]